MAAARYGQPVGLAPGVWRVTAPNPSPMTHDGTQSYVVVADGRAAVIDPGPSHREHLAALAAVLGGATLDAVLVTHSHADHSPGARPFAEAHGAPVLAFGPHGAGMSAQMRRLAAAGGDLGGGEGADAGFAPDREVADGERIGVGPIEIEALHTPGHLSNHLSFRLVGQGIVLTGDAVMGWSTTLVSPPEGDMAAQVATLGRLRALVADITDEPPVRFLPGHGPVVEDPARLLREQIAHREVRRSALVAALADEPADAVSLARRLYTDTPPALLPAAARNVLATLLQLMAEGEAEPCGPLSARVAFRSLSV
ncbi:MAG: MBL fold metallo-hydrolase [Pseudomonadota bacterium]